MVPIKGVKCPSHALLEGTDESRRFRATSLIADAALKVDGNEKREGSGRRQKFRFCMALWRSGVERVVSL